MARLLDARGAALAGVADSCFIHKNQLLVLWPRRHHLPQLVPKGRLLRGLGLQVAVAQPAQTKARFVEDLPHALPAIFEPKASIKKVPHQLGGPHTGVIARLRGDRRTASVTCAHCFAVSQAGRPGITLRSRPCSPA
jgi:hypothetical protein